MKDITKHIDVQNRVPERPGMSNRTFKKPGWTSVTSWVIGSTKLNQI